MLGITMSSNTRSGEGGNGEPECLLTVLGDDRLVVVLQQVHQNVDVEILVVNDKNFGLVLLHRSLPVYERARFYWAVVKCRNLDTI